MGIFSRSEPVKPVEPIVVEGEISRVGIISHNELSIIYGIHLVGRKERYEVSYRVGASVTTNEHITMASRGDRVRFGTDPRMPRNAIGFFENKTMAVDLG